MWNIRWRECGQISFHIVTIGNNISQCAFAHYFTFGNAEYFTWKTCKFMLLYLQKGGVIMADSKLRNLSTDIFAFRRVICPSARDICFASDMPAGVSGEYNITKTAGFNITFCASKIYHSVVDGISLKTNDYVRVWIHTQNFRKYLFHRQKLHLHFCIWSFFVYKYLSKNDKFILTNEKQCDKMVM